MTSLETALRQICADLTKAGHPFALVAKLEASARTKPRFTRDADIAVAVANDTEAEALIRNLRGGGYEIEAIVKQEAVGRLAIPESTVVSRRRCSKRTCWQADAYSDGRQRTP